MKHKKTLLLLGALVLVAAAVLIYLYNIDHTAPEVSLTLISPDTIHSVRDINVQASVSDDKRLDSEFSYMIGDVGQYAIEGLTDSNSEYKNYTQVISLKNLPDESVSKLVKENTFVISVEARDVAGNITNKSMSINLTQLLNKD